MGRHIPAWSLLLVGLCAATATAQTDDGIESGELGAGGSHTIRRRLYPPSGRKLDRRVRLSGVRGTGDDPTLADDGGNFTFRRLRAGTHTLTVEGGREFENATETVDTLAALRPAKR